MIETILMRLIRGGSLKALTGIDSVQTFGSGQLIRPLLAFSKKNYILMRTSMTCYFTKIQTNASNAYTRNRFRNIIIPQLEKENDQAKNHILSYRDEFG